MRDFDRTLSVVDFAPGRFRCELAQPSLASQCIVEGHLDLARLVPYPALDGYVEPDTFVVR